MSVFVVRASVLRLLVADEKWLRKLQKARNVDEGCLVLLDFCRAKNIKIKNVK